MPNDARADLGKPMGMHYRRRPNLGPDCSTARSARLRERRFSMAYQQRTQPESYARLADEARALFLKCEEADTAMARVLALRHVIDHCEVAIEQDAVFVGGEDPFFFNLLLPALQADRHSREGNLPPSELADQMRRASLFYAACFDGHITPGLEYILGQGAGGLRRRIVDQVESRGAAHLVDPEASLFYGAALAACDCLTAYADRYRAECLRIAAMEPETDLGRMAARAALLLATVPEKPARTLEEALQSYWLTYVLVTVEIGGCCPGGGLGLGRLDQFLYPFYERDLRDGRLTREQALELMELFLLNFRHVDYYTPHQFATPGSQSSLGGVTPTGGDGFNELSELIMEASLRIAMPTPYMSLRLYRDAPERYWHVAADYVLGGLGFPIVNDEVLIPAMLRHGRALYDARDYICSCCYEHTIPGREAFHPNGAYLNLPLVLELALNRGRTLLGDHPIGADSPDPSTIKDFDGILRLFGEQLEHVVCHLAALVNGADASHMANRRYPLMSLFIDDCLASAKDVCAGGARYNLVGCIVAGLPNVVNSLAAIRYAVYQEQTVRMPELLAALKADFEGYEDLRGPLLKAPKWGNGDALVDDLAHTVTAMAYAQLAGLRNARGGRWQMALYSFMANHSLGSAVGASADGRRSGTSLTRNLNPTWGTDRSGPTAVLQSLSAIDFTQSPDGSALDVRFDPRTFESDRARAAFAAFLRTFVDLGIMEMQVTMVDAETLRDAREHPERHQNLMVRVAGYSARFVDLPDYEQEEIIGRTEQRL